MEHTKQFYDELTKFIEEYLNSNIPNQSNFVKFIEYKNKRKKALINKQ